MNRLSMTILCLSLMVLAGCSKALTGSSASGVIQKWVDSQNGGVVTTFAGGLTNQIGAEMPNPWSAVGVQRLITQGYLEEKKLSVFYPNLSGQYNDIRESPMGLAVLQYQDTYDLRTVSSTSPPHVEGSFKTCVMNNCDTGSVNGAVQRNGPSSLTMSFNRSLVVTLQRGQPDALVGTYNNPANPLGQPSFPIRANRAGPNPPDIQQNVYFYNWTTKLPRDTFSGPMLKLGHLAVDSCEHLLLTSETAATASCKSHVKLTNAAEVVFGSRPTDQVIQASFGKQPDGTWIGTSVGYSPPQYNIFQ